MKNIEIKVDRNTSYVDLPPILINKGTNIIEVDTSILPSNMEVIYLGKK